MLATLPILTTVVLLTAPTAAFYKGLNFGATLPNGACRSQDDWTRGFKTMLNSKANFDIARVFASSDCNTLANAVPAALSTGVKILAGVWTEDDAHYSAEKGALLDALQRWPNWQNWLIAVSVGSEDLYRKEVPGSQITSKVYDVRGMLRAKGVTVPIGHVDTWTAWVDPDNKPLITACDFIGVDEYPFWQGATIPQSSEVFWDSIQDVIDATSAVKPGVPVWATETGWPVSGDNFESATSSIANARAYWKELACPSFNRINMFWYAYSEPSNNPSFSVFDENDQPLYDLSC